MASKRIEWLEEFEQLADAILSQQDTSACDQIHPIIKAWYEETRDSDLPPTREAVLQAMACLTTELMVDMPDALFDVLSQSMDDDDVAVWIHEILLIGRLFEQALQNGRLDDL